MDAKFTPGPLTIERWPNCRSLGIAPNDRDTVRAVKYRGETHEGEIAFFIGANSDANAALFVAAIARATGTPTN